MKTSEAIEQVNSTIFRPGWKLAAEPAWYGDHGDEINVKFRLDTMDTSHPDASGEYHVPIRLPFERLLRVGKLDEAGLCYALLKTVAEIDEHEDREFMRVRQPDGTWSAPLHPHTPDGEIAWLTREYAELLS